MCIVCHGVSADEIYISPFIYDVQNNIDTVIRIKGLASTMDMLNITTCNIMDLDSRIIMVINEKSVFKYFVCRYLKYISIYNYESIIMLITFYND